MKINLLDTRKGEIRVVPEDVIDLHVLYTIINPGDKAYAWTLRQLKSRGSQGEKRKGERVKVYLGIDVKDLELDELRGCLKIKGVVIEAPDWLPIKGKHHSLLITVGREVRIVKGKIREFELKRLMHHVKRGYVKVIIVALDRDEATIAILRGNKVEILSKIASNIPGKDTSERERRKALDKYIDDIVKVIENIRGREKVDYVIVAGPGMIKDILARKIMEETIGLTVVKESATSGTESGVYEVLRRGAKIKVLKDLELVQAQKALEEFMRRISKGDRKIA